MNWSKNVVEERDAPRQILFGSMDTLFCVLLTLAIFLEIFIDAGYAAASPYLFPFSEDIEIPSGATKAKSWIQRILRLEVFRLPAFCIGSLLGSHSLRKYARTRACNNGCSKDFVDIRGRWKEGRKRVGDVYDDVELSWLDGKVAAALCGGGPCKYVLKGGSGVTEDFLLQHVVPNIASLYPRKVALVLSKPLLWIAMTDVERMQVNLPEALTTRIRTA